MLHGNKICVPSFFYFEWFRSEQVPLFPSFDNNSNFALKWPLSKHPSVAPWSPPICLLTGTRDWPWQLSGPRALLTPLIFSLQPLNRHEISWILEREKTKWRSIDLSRRIANNLRDLNWPRLNRAAQVKRVFRALMRSRENMRPTEKQNFCWYRRFVSHKRRHWDITSCIYRI